MVDQPSLTIGLCFISYDHATDQACTRRGTGDFVARQRNLGSSSRRWAVGCVHAVVEQVLLVDNASFNADASVHNANDLQSDDDQQNDPWQQRKKNFTNKLCLPHGPSGQQARLTSDYRYDVDERRVQILGLDVVGGLVARHDEVAELLDRLGRCQRRRHDGRFHSGVDRVLGDIGQRSEQTCCFIHR